MALLLSRKADLINCYFIRCKVIATQNHNLIKLKNRLFLLWPVPFDIDLIVIVFSMGKSIMQKKQKSFIGLSSVLAIIICIVLISLLAMNLAIIIKPRENPDKVPNFFGIKPFVVLSGSMEPAIPAGDFVVVKLQKQGGAPVLSPRVMRTITA